MVTGCRRGTAAEAAESGLRRAAPEGYGPTSPRRARSPPCLIFLLPSARSRRLGAGASSGRPGGPRRPSALPSASRMPPAVGPERERKRSVKPHESPVALSWRSTRAGRGLGHGSWWASRPGSQWARKTAGGADRPMRSRRFLHRRLYAPRRGRSSVWSPKLRSMRSSARSGSVRSRRTLTTVATPRCSRPSCARTSRRWFGVRGPPGDQGPLVHEQLASWTYSHRKERSCPFSFWLALNTAPHQKVAIERSSDTGIGYGHRKARLGACGQSGYQRAGAVLGDLPLRKRPAGAASSLLAAR